MDRATHDRDRWSRTTMTLALTAMVGTTAALVTATGDRDEARSAAKARTLAAPPAHRDSPRARPAGVARRHADPARTPHAAPTDAELERDEVDEFDRLTPAERIERGRAALDRSLAALEDSTRSTAAHDRLRLEAAGALTRLRPELEATAEGRREFLAYAARFRETASD